MLSLLDGLAVAFVVAQEDVFQAGLVARQRHDGMLGAALTTASTLPDTDRRSVCPSGSASTRSTSFSALNASAGTPSAKGMMTLWRLMSFSSATLPPPPSCPPPVMPPPSEGFFPPPQIFEGR